MLPIAYTVGSEPDAAGFFDYALRTAVMRVTWQFAAEGYSLAHAGQFAIDQLCPGEWFLDISDPDEEE